MKRLLAASAVVMTVATPLQAAPMQDFDRSIVEASIRFQIPQLWIRAVIAVESAGNPRAISPSGAIGLMQIMPATWAVLRQRLHLGSDPYDPHDNVLAGTALLRELYDQFGASGFLAAYNAGPDRYRAYLTRGTPLAQETQTYLARIAPLLDNAGLADAVAAPGHAFNWRSAPVFVTALDRIPNGLQSAPQAAEGPAAVAFPDTQLRRPPDADPTRFAPFSAGLFVTVNTGDAP